MISRLLKASSALALLAAFAAGAHAQDATEGRKVASGICQTCHGLNGIAKQPDAANLAGQDAGYLSRQLHAFKSGDRKHEQMSIIASDLTDQQMEDVAAYYSAIKITVKPVPAASE